MIPSIISQAACITAGQLYPAYASFKAIKERNPEEYHRWLQYWIVHAFFSSASWAAEPFISWAPFYGELKVACCLWLVSPYTQGSTYVYRTFVHPLILQHEEQIDKAMATAGEKVTQKSAEAGRTVISHARRIVDNQQQGGAGADSAARETPKARSPTLDWIPSLPSLTATTGSDSEVRDLEQRIQAQREELRRQEQKLVQLQGGQSLASWLGSLLAPRN